MEVSHWFICSQFVNRIQRIMHRQGASNLNCITVGFCLMFAAFHDQFTLLTICIKLRLEMEIKGCKFCIQKFWDAEYWNLKIWNAEYRNFNRKLSLLPYLIRSLFFSQGILDYLDNLTVTQIRKLFSMLSTLAFANQQDGGLIQVICNKNCARALMYCRQDKARQCFIWSLIQSYVHRLGVDGGGWGRWGEYSPKFYTGRLFTEVQPLTLLYTIFHRKVFLSYNLYWQTVPLSQTWFRTVLHPF